MVITMSMSLFPLSEIRCPGCWSDANEACERWSGVPGDGIAGDLVGTGFLFNEFNAAVDQTLFSGFGNGVPGGGKG